jgi:hypothetical protein
MSYPYSMDHPNVREAGIVDSVPDEISEIQQHDPDDTALVITGKVTVAGVTRVQELPSVVSTSRSYLVSDTDVVPLLGRDARRKRCTILAISTVGQANAATGFWVGNREDVRSGNAAFWPVGVPLVLMSTEAVYVRAVTGTSPSTTLVSVIPENWAD